MKHIEQQSYVKTEGFTETKEFTVQFNSKMVKILSDGLYSDKVLAIIRELSTNALDSHIEADNANQPFDVHLPCWNQNEFWIRDYGTGMSPEKLWNLYTIYGFSDRSDSNDFAGKMGIGCKCFFGYNTRMATITSYYNGVMYEYHAYLNENNMPVLTKLYERPTTEPNGVKIFLKTDPKDEQLFCLAAQKVYRNFDVKPNVIGRKVQLPPMKYSLEGTNWKLRAKTEMFDGTGVPYAIMGPLAYPILISHNELGEKYRDVLACPFDISFSMGALDIEASREGLSYDNRTKVHIRSAFNIVLDECKTIVEDYVSKCKNLWEARKAFVDLKNTIPHSIYVSTDWSNVLYDKQKIFASSMSVGYVDLSKYVCNGDLKIHKFEKGWSSKVSQSEVLKINITRIVDDKFYEMDMQKGTLVRCKQECQRTGFVYLFEFVNKAKRQEILNYIGIDSSYLVPASSLKYDKAQRSNTGIGSKTRVTIFNKLYSGKVKNKYWSNDNIDLSIVNGVYLETYIYDFKFNGKDVSPQKIKDITSLMVDCGIKIPVIYGIKSKDIPTIKKNPKCVNFFDWAIDAVQKLCYTTNVEDAILCKKECANLFDYSCFREDNYASLARRLPSDHIIPKFMNAYRDTAKLSKSCDDLVSLVEKMNKLNSALGIPPIKLSKSPSTLQLSLQKQRRIIQNKYKLLQHFHVYDINVADVVQYILMVDK